MNTSPQHSWINVLENKKYQRQIASVSFLQAESVRQEYDFYLKVWRLLAVSGWAAFILSILWR
jgi:hypothetical protein